MKWSVYYTEIANDDLHAIYEYIAYDLNSPIAAAKQINRIMRVIEELDTNPMGFPLYKNEPWRSQGLRFVPVDKYMIFFLTYEDENTVKILRIMYGGRNIDSHINNIE